MSTADLNRAIERLAQLSDSRAQRVLSLLEDLTQLEALENAVDLKSARETLHAAEESVPWNEVKAKLDEKFGLP